MLYLHFRCDGDVYSNFKYLPDSDSATNDKSETSLLFSFTLPHTYVDLDDGDTSMIMIPVTPLLIPYVDLKH